MHIWYNICWTSHNEGTLKSGPKKKPFCSLDSVSCQLYNLTKYLIFPNLSVTISKMRGLDQASSKKPASIELWELCGCLLSLYNDPDGIMFHGPADSEQWKKKIHSAHLPGLLILNIQHNSSMQFTSILLEGKGWEDSLPLFEKKRSERTIRIFLIFFLLGNWSPEIPVESLTEEGQTFNRRPGS